VGALFIARASVNASDGPRPSLHRDLLVLLSLFAAVVMILFSKCLMASHGALPVTAATITLGTIVLLAWVELSRRGDLFQPSTPPSMSY
jgi:hypothetical protein